MTPGDRFRVFTATGNYTTPGATFDSWAEAKEARNAAFFGDETVQSAWIMRDNPSLNIRATKYGETLRRDKRAKQNAPV